MKRRNWIAIMLVVLLMLSVAACGAPAGKDTDKTSESFPSGPITFIVPFAPGGANDICARLIAPEVEKILGVPVTVTNTEGAGGWIGYDTLLAADADGLTVSMVSNPGVITNYLNPDAGRTNTYRDFAGIVNFANDYAVVCCNPDEDRFSTFEELYEYSQTNEVLISGTAGASTDGITIAKLNQLEGVQFVHLATNGASESLTNLYGKHCDVAVIDISETLAPVRSGQLKPLAVTSDERVQQNPDIPTILEEVGESVVNFSARGIITKAGVPEEDLKILRDAFTQALETDSLKEKLAEQGIQVEITNWEDFEKYMETTETEMKVLGPKFFGWN